MENGGEDHYDAAYEEALGVLESEMQRYMTKGFQVVYDSEDRVQMVRPKTFSFVAFFLFSPFLYLPYYFSKRDDHVVLWVDQNNRLRKKGKGALTGVID